MSSSQSFVDYVCDQTGLAGALSQRKMFGEYALYIDARVVALVCDDHLFLKPTREGRLLLDEVREQPPYPGAKPYLLIDDAIDDAERLRQLFTATARALPAPKLKSAKRSKRA